ncbi:MAG: hypothetical protein KC729_12720, partial [Candidatus Eisenbacteria bacterium]|nr:hypothetical protein [Candidatus Eisenbacteria bacterium]
MSNSPLFSWILLFLSAAMSSGCGADPSRTPLEQAAVVGDPGRILDLIQRGVDPDRMGSDGLPGTDVSQGRTPIAFGARLSLSCKCGVAAREVNRAPVVWIDERQHLCFGTLVGVGYPGTGRFQECGRQAIEGAEPGEAAGQGSDLGEELRRPVGAKDCSHPCFQGLLVGPIDVDPARPQRAFAGSLNGIGNDAVHELPVRGAVLPHTD